MSLDSPLVTEARQLARAAHADHFRKAGSIPYFVHLDSVARLLEAHGYCEDAVLAAAYLHDLIEDRPSFRERFVAAMPREVVATVEALTEVKADEIGRPLDKRKRFEGYLRQLHAPTEAVQRAIPISCADKIDNIRSIVEAERSGAGLLLRLRTRPGEHAVQLSALRRIYAPLVRASLLAEFDAAARQLQALIAAWIPGRAVQLAAEAHLGQFDRAGEPYIGHPLRLWLRAETSEEKMTAVLHDVVEDTPWTLESLGREGFPESVLRALDCLTRRDGEPYEAFIDRVAEDRLATRVKLLDLEDNSDPRRLPILTDVDRARLEKYRKASERLRRVLATQSPAP